ncbi:MAG TPA: hypothetical protein VGF63_00190 [Solirubrobacteraceae bacterium]
MLIDDPEQPGRRGRRAVVSSSHDDLVVDEVVSVDDDANLVARVELQCRALTHHNAVSHRARPCDAEIEGRWGRTRSAASPCWAAIIVCSVLRWIEGLVKM